jgi:hypothetical protein
MSVVVPASEGGLSLTAESTSVQANGTITLNASGGSGSYTFSVSTNQSGSSIGAVSGSSATYTAGLVAHDTDQVTVTDQKGNTASLLISVAPAAPDHFTKISGDLLSAQVESNLSPEVKVQLFDRYGNTITGQPVAILQILGFDAQLMSSPLVDTDANGMAAFTIKLGSSMSEIWQVVAVGASLANVSAVAEGKAPLFKETATSVAPGSGTYANRYYAVGPSGDTNGATTVDLQGNGSADLVVLNAEDNTISVLLSNGDGTFQTAANYSVGAEPDAIAVGDFNKDGKNDIAIENYNSNSISVLINNGNGTFKPAVNYGTGSYTDAGIVTADFNGDGNLDLIACNNGNLGLLLGNGDGTFQAATTLPVPGGAGFYINLKTADFNGDGKADLALTDSDGNLIVMLGNGDGTFTTSFTAATGGSYGGLSIADLRGNGKFDIILPEYFASQVGVFLGKGDGTFQAAANYATVGYPASVAIGDINGDGKVDVAVQGRMGGLSILYGTGGGAFSAAVNSTNGGTWSITGGNYSGSNFSLAVPTGSNTAIYLGNGDGTFKSPSATPITSTTGSYTVVHAADLDKDGYLDTVALDSQNGLIAIFLGNGDGTFKAQISYAVPDAKDFALADFNGDGVLDIVVAQGANGLGVLLGNGNGTFQAVSNFNATGVNAVGVTAGDFNGDGKADIVYADSSLPGFGIVLGNGNGTFKTAVKTTLGNQPSKVATGDFNSDGNLDFVMSDTQGDEVTRVLVSDFNSDGIPDLAVVNSTGTSFSILLGNGNGTFGAATGYPANNAVTDLTAGDINADGVTDLVVSENNSTVGVFLGNSNGTFQSEIDYDDSSSSVTVGNFDGTGKLGLVFGSSTMSYLPAN